MNSSLTVPRHACVPERSRRRASAARPTTSSTFGSSLAFFLLHLLPFLAIFTGVTRTALILAFVTFTTRMFFITAGLPPVLLAQVVPAESRVGSSCSRSAARWRRRRVRCGGRRITATTTASPTPNATCTRPSAAFGGATSAGSSATSTTRPTAARSATSPSFPELRFIDKHDWIGPWTLGAICFLIGGWSGLLIGFFASTVLLWHVTFTVNSVAHVMGRRAYETDDTSRNTLLVALATGGEGWHNNHHRYPWAARQGFRWWQIDVTYYVLRALSWVGIVRDLRPVPAAVIDEARVAKAQRRAAGTSRSSR